MSKLIGLIFAWIILFGISCVSMIQGWGVEPESWGWIVFCFICMCVMQILIAALGRDES